jgi:hypothetical protein
VIDHSVCYSEECGWPVKRNSILSRDIFFPSLKNRDIIANHSVSYSVDIRGLSPGIKRSWNEPDYSP